MRSICSRVRLRSGAEAADDEAMRKSDTAEGKEAGGVPGGRRDVLHIVLGCGKMPCVR